MMRTLMLAVLVGASACVVRVPPPMVALGPPPARVEVIPRQPGPHHVWVAGYWSHRGGRWFWVPGAWTVRRHGHRWDDGRWVRQPHGWVWVPGGWRRG